MAASKTKKKPAAKPKGRPKNKKTQEIKKNNRMVEIILFAIGVFVTLLIIPGKSGWLYMHRILFGFFSLAAFLAGPFMIYISVLMAMEKPYKKRMWQALFVLLLFGALIQIIGVGEIPGDSFLNQIATLYDDGVSLKGGGIFGALLSWPMLAALGKTGSLITTLILLFVVVMMMTGATLIGFLRGVSKPARKIKSEYQRMIEEQEKEADDPQKENGYFLIDDPKAGSRRFSVPGYLSDDESPKSGAVVKSKQAVIDAAVDEKDPVFTGIEDQKLDILINNATPSVKEKTAPIIDEKEQVRLYNDQKADSYTYPPLSLLKAARFKSNKDVSEELKSNADKLVSTLKSFGVDTKIIAISRGPSVTRYELQPSAGVKISKITGLADDIALNLASAGVRIEAPIPNKPAVGIEVPNKITDIVTLREIIESMEFEEAESRLTFAVGRDITGDAKVADIGKMPHMLIAGATGSGKSVCINSLIISLIYKSSPQDVRLLMIDPKVVELGVYNGIPHLLVPVVTDPRKAAGALGWAVTEMLDRYKKFADAGVRDIEGYNSIADASDDMEKMPQIVIIIDELADLMMAAPNEVEDSICRLAQMARAAGMHLVIATQRPSVDVITGVIKANIPSRIAFAVSSQVDSRTIIDTAGADKLLGRGDMLFYPVGIPKPVRIQGCFVSDKEVEQVVSFIKKKETDEYDDSILEEIDKQAAKGKGAQAGGGGFDEEDEMLSAAVDWVVESGQASTSFLQRKLKLGYARASRLMDVMEEKGIVGPPEGSKPRQVLISRQQWIEMKLNNRQADTE